MKLLLAAVGIPDTTENTLHAGSAVEWIRNNTTIKVNLDEIDSIPYSVKLFVLKYTQLMTNFTGVASESISGLSQSFVTGQELDVQIYNLAVSLFGLSCIKSTVTVFSGEEKWQYGC